MSEQNGSDFDDSEPLSSPWSTPGGSRTSTPRPNRDLDSVRGGRSPQTPGPTDDLFGSEDEEPVARKRPKAERSDALEDLFGSDDDDATKYRPNSREEDSERRSPSDRHSMSADEEEDRVQDEGDSEERGELSKVEVRVMSARVPVLSAPRSSEGRYIIARTPNILQLDPTPFSAQAYEDLISEEHRAVKKHGYASAVSPELASAVEGIISNTIRWRRVKDRDGAVKRQSNARLVRWSDGSTTMVIGGSAPEVYSVSAEPLVAKEALRKPEQHHYAAVHHSRELLMQNHARLTEQWSFRPSRQSAQTRHAVSLLLPRIKATAAGRGRNAGPDRLGGTKSGGTRFMVADEDPEMIAKREELEEERREKQRRREEKQRERREARDSQRSGYDGSGYGNAYAAGDYSEDDREYGYESGDAAGEGGMAYERQRPVQREASRFGVPQFGRRPRSAYMDEDEDDGFVVDDDVELEVGPRDEFDDEEDEEERISSRLNSAKRTTHGSGDDSDTGEQGAHSAKSRRLKVSDDEDDIIDDF
ncbi:Paf1 complex component [Dipsacomyces acuminosporus]|nr:Paf1 complex component [Dipsacomyces acuminosporus]